MVISKISFKFLIFTQIENRSVIWNQLSDNIQNLKRKLLHFIENTTSVSQIFSGTCTLNAVLD